MGRIGRGGSQFQKQSANQFLDKFLQFCYLWKGCFQCAKCAWGISFQDKDRDKDNDKDNHQGQMCACPCAPVRDLPSLCWLPQLPDWSQVSPHHPLTTIPIPIPIPITSSTPTLILSKLLEYWELKCPKWPGTEDVPTKLKRFDVWKTTRAIEI